MKPVITAVLLALGSIASAQDYYAPESPRIPEFGRWQPIYRHPIQQPAPWYIPGSAADPFRQFRPLPWGSVGIVYICTGYEWAPERRCRCW